jgi:hypothetical protein
MCNATYRQNGTSGQIKIIINYAHDLPLQDPGKRMSVYCSPEKIFGIARPHPYLSSNFDVKNLWRHHRKIYNYAIKIGDSHFVAKDTMIICEKELERIHGK